MKKHLFALITITTLLAPTLVFAPPKRARTPSPGPDNNQAPIDETVGTFATITAFLDKHYPNASDQQKNQLAAFFKIVDENSNAGLSISTVQQITKAINENKVTNLKEFLTLANNLVSQQAHTTLGFMTGQI